MLPSKDDFPQYFEFTETPISLAEVRENVRTAKYDTLAAFESDLKLMFNNARRFNAVGSRLWLAAESLERLAARKLEKGTGKQAQQLVGSDKLGPELATACAPASGASCANCRWTRGTALGYWHKSRWWRRTTSGARQDPLPGLGEEVGRVVRQGQRGPRPAGTHTDQVKDMDEVLPADDQSLLTARACVLPKVTLKVTATGSRRQAARHAPDGRGRGRVVPPRPRRGAPRAHVLRADRRRPRPRWWSTCAAATASCC